MKLPRRALSAWVAEGATFVAFVVATRAVGGNGSEGANGNLGGQFVVGFFGLVGLIAMPFVGHHADFMRKTIYTAP